DRAFSKPELVPVDPEAIVQLAAIDGPAPRTPADMRLKRLELEHPAVDRAPAAFAGEQSLLGGKGQWARDKRVQIHAKRCGERLQRSVYGAASRPQRLVRYENTHLRATAGFCADPTVHSASVTISPRRSIVTLCSRADSP